MFVIAGLLRILLWQGGAPLITPPWEWMFWAPKSLLTLGQENGLVHSLPERMKIWASSWTFFESFKQGQRSECIVAWHGCRWCCSVLCTFGWNRAVMVQKFSALLGCPSPGSLKRAAFIGAFLKSTPVEVSMFFAPGLGYGSPKGNPRDLLGWSAFYSTLWHRLRFVLYAISAVFSCTQWENRQEYVCATFPEADICRFKLSND